MPLLALPLQLLHGLPRGLEGRAVGDAADLVVLRAAAEI